MLCLHYWKWVLQLDWIGRSLVKLVLFRSWQFLYAYISRIIWFTFAFDSPNFKFVMQCRLSKTKAYLSCEISFFGKYICMSDIFFGVSDYVIKAIPWSEIFTAMIYSYLHTCGYTNNALVTPLLMLELDWCKCLSLRFQKGRKISALPQTPFRSTAPWAFKLRVHRSLALRHTHEYVHY